MGLLPVMQELWRGKVYVPARQLVLAGSLTYAQAYVQSLRHAAAQHITIPELCGFRWLFRCGSSSSSVHYAPLFGMNDESRSSENRLWSFHAQRCASTDSSSALARFLWSTIPTGMAAARQ